MPKKIPSGRGGAVGEARELICLISALAEPGDVVDPAAVKKRLGCSAEHAEKLLRILADASAGELRIPLTEDEGTYQLVSANGLHGARLSLTAPERQALLAAEATIDKADKTLLFTCANCINLQQYLVFGYRKAAGAGLERRCILPKKLYRDRGNWLLTGHDTSRNDSRTFRLDRMCDARRSAQPVDTQLAEGSLRQRQVRIFFDDLLYLELFEWPGLVLDDAADSREATGTIPYFGTTWLVRQLASCGGSVHTNDRELNELAVAYAKKQLNGASRP